MQDLESVSKPSSKITGTGQQVLVNGNLQSEQLQLVSKPSITGYARFMVSIQARY